MIGNISSKSFKFSLKRQLGVGMIEVLVTIIITAIGLLGVAKMQSVALQYNHDSSQRSQAIFYIEDIISRMRAVGSANLSSYDTFSASGLSNNGVGGGQITSEPTPVCDSDNPCSVTQKINHDLWEWEQIIDGRLELKSGTPVGGLLNAAGCIQVNNNSVTITIAWDAIDNAVKTTSSISCGADSSSRRQATVTTII